MPDILHRVGIQASAEKVYWALTDEEGSAGWWTRNVKAPPGVGSAIEFRFDDKGFNDMRVLELIPGKRVRWQSIDGAQPTRPVKRRRKLFGGRLPRENRVDNEQASLARRLLTPRRLLQAAIPLPKPEVPR